MKEFTGGVTFPRAATAALLTAAGVIGIGASTTKPAQAQRPLRLTLGVSTPVTHGDSSSSRLGRQGFGGFGGGGARSYTATTGPLVRAGISYDVKPGQDGRPAYNLYLDSGTLIGGFFETVSNYAAVGASARFEKPSGLYYGAGLGMYRLSPRGRNYAPDNGIKPGLRLFVGRQGSGSVFVEIDATLTGKVNGEGFTNSALLLGLRL